MVSEGDFTVVIYLFGFRQNVIQCERGEFNSRSYFLLIL